MNDDSVDIGEVVARTGVPVSTLHVWESRGLITPTGRSGLRRQYDRAVIDRIAMIVLGQRSGFSLSELRELVRDDGATDRRSRFEAKLVDLRDRRASLDTAISSLEHALACEYDPPMSCPTFRALLAAVLPAAGSHPR